MSYIDQENGSRRIAVGGVVLLHIVVGYALISGFAINVITRVTTTTTVGEYPDDPPPPRHDDPPPPPKHREVPPPTLDQQTQPLTVGTREILTDEVPKIVYPPFQQVETPKPQPQIVSKARAAIAGPSRATWVTNDDYPTAALRDEVQGVVAIDVAIGADGRVTACSVTSSSGSDALDQATCRLYARRARFQPALDDGGQPTVGRHSDRIRWQIPQ